MKMDKIKNIYNKYYKNLNTSPELKNEIMNATLFKQKNNFNIKKCILTASIVISISIISIGIVFADEIKEKIYNYLTIEEIGDEDTNKISISQFVVKNLKKIKYNADLEAITYSSYNEKYITIQEIENKLEIKIIDSEKFINKTAIIYLIEKVDENIASGKFLIKDAFNLESKKSRINLMFQFNTKYSKMYENGFYFTIGATDNYNDELITTKYLENLQTDVYFFTTIPNLEDDVIVSQMDAAFVYDDIGYILSGVNVSREMIIEILNSFK